MRQLQAQLPQVTGDSDRSQLCIKSPKTLSLDQIDVLEDLIGNKEVSDADFKFLCDGGEGSHPLGPELHDVATLFYRKSPVAGKDFGKLLHFLLGISSVQATIPPQCILLLQDLTQHDEPAASLAQTYTTVHKNFFQSYMGQPLLCGVLQNIISQIEGASRTERPSVVKQGNQLLSFLQYTCDCIKLSLPLSIRAEILSTSRPGNSEGVDGAEEAEPDNDPVYTAQEALRFLNAGEAFPPIREKREMPRTSYTKLQPRKGGKRCVRARVREDSV